MKKSDLISELLGEIKKSRSVLDKLDAFYKEFKSKELVTLGKSKVSGIVMSEIMVDFYTCLETLFIKISQFYENTLRKDKWHTDLLYKMSLEIEGLRIAVISNETYSILLEFMKFRHFKRYYFEFDYDWDKLEYLEKKYIQLGSLLNRDLNHFETFLHELKER